MKRIPIAGPWITQREIDYVRDAVANAWYENANVYHDRFERAFAGWLGSRFAVVLPSCTSAIHLSLLALGVGPGDEVIVPDITWIASAAPVSYVGAIPVFADIDARTWCISAESLAQCITPKTKAVIPVDLYGNVPDMDAILRIARDRGIAVIEDAAEAIGAEYRGQKAGSFGDTGVFSFHGSKTVTTGEGGMLVTNREDVYQRVLFLRSHGRLPGAKMFFNTEVAYKYALSSMQAALGLAQLERVDELVGRKREIFRWYEQRLRRLNGVALNYEAAETKNAYWMVTAIVDRAYGLEKDELLGLISARGIDGRPFFRPLTSLPAYAGVPAVRQARERNRVSYAVSPYGINLPSSLAITREQVSYVCDALEEVLAQHSLAMPR